MRVSATAGYRTLTVVFTVLGTAAILALVRLPIPWPWSRAVAGLAGVCAGAALLCFGRSTERVG